MTHELVLPEQRIGAMAAVLVFLAALLALELPLTAGMLRMGRNLEVRLRIAFLGKMPRLADRYFQSRPISDMVERCHTIHHIRQLPQLLGRLVRLAFGLMLTVLGIIWLGPQHGLIAVLGALSMIGLPLLGQPILTERDVRVRTHNGALGRYYLDAFLGLVPIRAHAAEHSVAREHEALLVEWTKAGYRLQSAAMITEGLQILAGFGFAGWLLFAHLAEQGATGGGLLLIYWALNLPVLGQEFALILRQYPVYRNTVLRVLEPLDAPDDAQQQNSRRNQSMSEPGIGPERFRGPSIHFENVDVHVSGHRLLHRITFAMDAGTHLAVVGKSGAGKSSLVGVLRGWYRPAAGKVSIDGQNLDAQRIESLRNETAWVDPAIRIWNRTIYENLIYGNSDKDHAALGYVIRDAGLRSLLESFPEGLQELLGEGGGMVSGGEGQRVRLARAMLRSNVRLAILDEPFRGLERDKRRILLRQARHLWQDRTLICVTHDIADTLDFDRVLVLENGRIIEDGDPALLSKQHGSHYQSLLIEENHNRKNLWQKRFSRHLHLRSGRFTAVEEN